MESTNIWQCVIYLAVISFGSFVIGRFLPYRWFRADRFPYAPMAFEQGGKFYQKLGVPQWQNRLPDMSKVFPKLMPSKNMSNTTPEGLQTMIEETCIAEFIHMLLAVLGFGALYFLPNWLGIAAVILYSLIGNLPFVAIQRYNRPRLIRLKALAIRRRERRSAAIQ